MATLNGLSESFYVFMTDAPGFSGPWMDLVQTLQRASGLDAKTQHLCYLSALAAARLVSGIPLHVRLARSEGATKEEVVSAILAGLPAVGNTVIESLPPALEAFKD